MGNKGEQFCLGGWEAQLGGGGVPLSPPSSVSNAARRIRNG